jgi:hypothetical protein
MDTHSKPYAKSIGRASSGPDADTVSIPLRYKKKENQTQTEEGQTKTREKEKYRRAFLYDRNAGVSEEGSQGSGVKGSRLLTAQERWRLRNPQALTAHRAVQAAVRRGTLVRLPCEVCGDPRSDFHHPNYAEPLVGKFLCRKHHKAVHRRKIVKGPGQ